MVVCPQILTKHHIWTDNSRPVCDNLFMDKSDKSLKGIILPAALLASAILSLLALTGIYLIPGDQPAPIDMYIEGAKKTIVVGDSFPVSVVTTSDTPVNVFTGTVMFDPEVLEVSEINYNTTIIDLWTEKPWFVNGDGTVHFAGGTTDTGGFVGTASILTITFTAKAPGEAELFIDNARVLEHNGLGTDAELTNAPELIFSVSNETASDTVFVEKTTDPVSISVIESPRTADINDDGKVTFADISVFMVYLATQDMRADLDADGKVNTADLSIILDQL